MNTLLTVTRDAAAQQPTKMGFKVGTTVTLDNALKMLMVKSANDIAVTIAEGLGGSLEGFADMMNANARRLGMSQSNFVNPNGLPAENHVSSARDLAILARALIRRIPAIRFVLARSCDPLRQSRHAQLQFAARPLSRRRRHEDRVHLRLGL